MRIIIIHFLFSLSIAESFCQGQSLEGTWYSKMDDHNGIESAVMIFTPDGYYYNTTQFTGTEFYQTDPDINFGIYRLEANILKIYDLKNDVISEFMLSHLTSDGFNFNHPEFHQPFVYKKKGPWSLSAEQRLQILSWDNYRKLGGTWRSSKTIIKAIPKLGLILIRTIDNVDFFHWGQYEFNGNVLTMKSIDAEQQIFYRGNVQKFDKSMLVLTSNDESEKLTYYGGLNLDEKESFMVNEYIKMNHRLSMTTIDMIDGVRDFIWKRTDQYGNVID